MKKVSKDKLIEIVQSLMLRPDEDVLDKIMTSWEDIQLQLEGLNSLDLDNLQPMERINEDLHIDLLREDVEDDSYSISKDDILKNAPTSDGDFVTLTKVVK
ncbi:Asp-tRNA(Asn)/Glu-tRNA(Gln) amidotransferase subunit GatC [Mycoplasma seminis]|uniref:Asp-tRNA(Asn)/Glu-tRNA(Gln) amidotransferase subunit GatC n=1 Tax=Mycoplasma seminis TaxID=512749 RepID=A0ABY9HBM4_9MOLU|nr:Asp-tRNA(Asn)/Glu-tRNA(Gln) amidotransferase subunit GatC [Mycoplasma seminis]WLP85753.1 Asp-tRNA(Asn)/Glu-tRNA(Gln) amidotransferase subunit GatC [Mycoplasma seminis]